MSDRTPASVSGSRALPDHPDLDWLRKQAKRRLEELRQSNAGAKLADAQLQLAREYGFSSWRALKVHIDARSTDGQLFEAVQKGDVASLAALLDEHPDALHATAKPYGHTLLHAATQHGQLEVVTLLLERGLHPDVREQGDDTYPMHWAAAAGRVDIVRRLADAGGDVVGNGDDHQLGVIGWATCWDGCDDEAHRAVVEFVLSRGARHHIFSAIAMNDAAEVRRIVARDPSALNHRMSRNEDNQLPLHFAVRKNRPGMVALLIELGADPLAPDASGHPAAAMAFTPEIDRAVMQKIHAMTTAELRSADKGHRPPRSTAPDLLAALALADWKTAEFLLHQAPDLIDHGGLLHLMAKRGDAPAVKWLLDHGANPNALWAHWDANVAPLHLAAWGGHAGIAHQLLAAGADPAIRDSKHDSDALGWAEFFGRLEVVRLLAKLSSPPA